MTAYREKLAYVIQWLLYPGFACVVTGAALGTTTPSVLAAVLERLGISLLSIVVGLILARGMSFARETSQLAHKEDSDVLE
jgi:hypothetical protein